MSRRARLLIIDDSPVLFHSLNEFCSQEFSVTRVADGKAGIDLATGNPPDLIIIMELPDRDIKGMIDALRNHPALNAIPVLVLLAESTVGKALRAGASATDPQGAHRGILRELLIPRLRSLLTCRPGCELDENQISHEGRVQLGESMQVRSLEELSCDFAHVL